MKTLISLTVLLAASIQYVQAQTPNTVPSTGNVGIGTTSPTTKLQVNGTAQVDSMLVVKDSMLVHKTARLKSDLKVEGDAVFKSDATVKSDFKVNGQATLIGDVLIKEGDLKVKSLGDSTLPGDGVLLINANGKVKNGGDLKSLVYGVSAQPALPCLADVNGNIVYSAPYWQAGPEEIFVLNNACLPDVRVGIGVKPDAKLHIRTSVNKTTHPILVERNDGANTQPYKLLQLDAQGLLYAREVKVNLDSWPDYVFEEGYTMLTLEELAAYIRLNGHLPNVPSAEEMKAEGVNVAETNVMLMEKVEELTLYLLQVQQQVKEQEALLKQQETLLKQQQETLRLQQLLLEQLQQAQTTAKP